MAIDIITIKKLLPLLTPFTLPEDAESAGMLYNLAYSRTTDDAPNLSDDDPAKAEAICWYLAHLLFSQSGSAGIQSESLGNWSVSYKSVDSGKTKSANSAYLAEYERIITSDIQISSTIVGHNDMIIADILGNDDGRRSL